MRTLLLGAGLVPFLFLVACGQKTGGSQNQNRNPTEQTRVQLGAEVLLAQELPNLKGKKIGIVAHAATRLPDSTHLVDRLQAEGLKIVRIFAPEHGFRGSAEAGEKVEDGRDPATGLPVVSLYGPNKRPAQRHLQDLDLLLFDLQDVGVRFYTYLSTLAYTMEACAEAGLPIWVLDRPNPNGWYTGGPVLESGNESFVGVHPIPMVHGLTLGEYARMINNNGWQPPCTLRVIRLQHYRHNLRWAATGLPWFAPSPNLPTPLSAELYPVLGLLEGTAVSVGRGTDLPFQQAGFPQHTAFQYRIGLDSVDGTPPTEYELFGAKAVVNRFRPEPRPGAASTPKLQGRLCYGLRFRTAPGPNGEPMMLAAHLLTNFYNEYNEYYKRLRKPNPEAFFRPIFRLLAGSGELQQQLRQAPEPEQLVAQWKEAGKEFRAMRRRYLLYPER